VEAVHLDRFPTFRKGLQIAFSFLLFCFTLNIFRSKSLSDAFYVITHLGAGLGSSEGIKMSIRALYDLGMDRYQLIFALIPIVLMVLVEGMEPQKNMRQMFFKKPILFRWVMYYVIILFLIFFGEYNDQAFIYFQF
jgi:hypothetical protein